MKLVVGLGNPGKEYENTRHNVGFKFIDKYLLCKNLNNWKEKFDGLYIDTIINGEKVIFLKPQKYMNLSGEVVKKFIDYFKISPSDILIISDDLDLNIGNYKLKNVGSCGGHNGLRNIEDCIGTKEYKRLKIGISNNKNLDTKNYVLGSFSINDNKILDSLYEVVNNIIDDYFKLDFSIMMNKYNRKNR